MASTSALTQSEARWYYAVDDAHIGPVTAEKFWNLAEEGVIHSDTLVWCTGYADWVPAKTVDGLSFGKKRSKTPDPAIATPVSMSPPAVLPEESGDVYFVMQIAKGGMLLGLLIVLFSRGCDAVDQARVDGLAAQRETSELEFTSRWESQFRPLQAAVDELEAKKYATTEDKAKLQQAIEELSTAKLMEAEERKDREISEWGLLRIRETQAVNDYRESQMFRRISGLLGGTLILLGIGAAIFYAPPDQQLGVWIALAVIIAAAYLS